MDGTNRDTFVRNISVIVTDSQLLQKYYLLEQEACGVVRPPLKVIRSRPRRCSGGATMNYRFTLVVIFLCAICISVLPLFAQEGAGAITGHVTDSTGAAVPNAQVTAANAATQVRTTATTNSAGIYVLSNLLPGTYSVEASAKDFKRAVRTNVLLQVSDNIGLDFSLEVGSVKESIVVTTEAPQLRSEDAQVGEVVNERMIETVVNIGRNPLTLITLAGNVQGSGAPAGANLSLGGGIFNAPNDTRVNGGRESAVEYLVDGVPATGGFVHQVVNTTPNTEDVQEFKVITNGMSSEFGRLSGGVVEVATKSGANQFHGQLFEYHQDQFFDANGWGQDNQCAFGRLTGGSTAACTKAPFHQNDFGFAVGGPVLIPHLYNGRNKTFWFANAEWLRNNTPGGSAITTTITEQERNSIPDPFNGNAIKTPTPCPDGTVGGCADLTDIGNAVYNSCATKDPQGNCLQTPYPYPAIGNPFVQPDVNGNRPPDGGDGRHVPVNQLNPAILRYVSLMPHANIAPVYGTTGWNYQYRSASKTDTLKWDVRLDHNINDKQHIYGRFTHDNETFSSSPAFPNFANTGTELKGGFGATLHYDYVISPTVVLDLNTGGNYSPAAFGHFVSGRGANTAGWGFQPSVTNMVGNTLLSIGQVRDEASANGGGDVIGQYLNGPTLNALNTTNFMYSVALTKILNRHTMKFGYEGRRYYDNFNQPAGSNPTGDGFFITGAGSFLNVADDGNIWGNTQDDANNMGTFLWGLDSWAHATTSTSRALATNYYASYMQDDFKVNKKLTVNLGVRWEMQTPVTERNNNLTVWDPLAPAPFTLTPGYNFNQSLLNAGLTQAQAGQVQAPGWAQAGAFSPGGIVFVDSPEHRARTATGYHPWNFSPRLGFAYQAMRNTVVRGSFGVFYLPIGNSITNYGDTPGVAYTTQSSTEFGNNAINYEITQPGFQTITNAFPLPGLELAAFGHNSQMANLQTATAGSGSGGVLMTSHMPHELDWSFGIQRQLPKNWLVEATYSANHSSDLLGLEYPSRFPKNLYTGGPGGPNWNLYSLSAPNPIYVQSPFAGQVPAGGFTGGQTVGGSQVVSLAALEYAYPYFGPVNVEDANIGRANYQSGNLRVEKRLSDGLQILLNYTYSKALDNVGGPDQTAQPSQAGQGSLGKTFQSVDTIANVYGLAAADQTHRLVVAYNYQLPFGHGRRWMNSQAGILGNVIEGAAGGWEISGVTNWSSGVPVSIGVNNTNVDQNIDIYYTQGNLAPGAALQSLRASGASSPGSTLCDIFCSSAHPSSSHPTALNLDALAQPAGSAPGSAASFTYGYLPPVLGFIRQPSTWGTDIAVMKRFPIMREGATYFQLRLEGQNIFNHPTLGGYDTNVTDSTYGMITGKNGSRVVQISGRFVF